MENNKLIKTFINKNNKFAIVGVSRDITKYGRIIYEKLKKLNYKVYGINPNIKFINEDKIYNQLSEIKDIDVVIFVVHPEIVKKYLNECKKLKINKIWLQPGSESPDIIQFCKENNIDCLFNQCIILNSQEEKND